MKDWTVGIFMAGDEDLDGASIRDICEMEQIGSDDKLNILVQLDRRIPFFSNEGKWGDARRFVIQKGVASVSHQMVSTPVTYLGETNTGDPETLRDFLSWICESGSAKHQMLILWGHGHGWKGLCDDIESEDYLTVKELVTALAESDSFSDILGFDACLMSNLEFLYEIREYCTYVIVSEEKIPNKGWPYHYLLPELQTEQSPEEIGSQIVNLYAEFYREQKSEATLAVFKSKMISELVALVDRLADLLQDLSESEFDKVKKIAGQINRCTDKDYVDLIDLVDALKKELGSRVGYLPDMLKIIYRLMTPAFQTTCTDNFYHGMSIYLPIVKPTDDLITRYAFLGITQDFPCWFKFLNRIWGSVSWEKAIS